MAGDEMTGRRIEDHLESTEQPGMGAQPLVAYRLGILETEFRGFERTLTEFETKMDSKISAALEVANGQRLVLYRLEQLEKWRGRFFAALQAVSTGLIIGLVLQIIAIKGSG